MQVHEAHEGEALGDGLMLMPQKGVFEKGLKMSTVLCNWEVMGDVGKMSFSAISLEARAEEGTVIE